ncbi:serine/threonine-protein phosphatase 6 regulatory ankyrin repeat subunit B-like [Pyrus ussuriensis x Pyrus communis]|uniref:Serine/threonine-protein phosphatase 6 regulatory ankyrin repeat subunit B-like n=1 Tax=Pyrus ussuriensis x Pyrus communis TaxID=2448454 RepID=A0A5N5HD63_9ROSA|nr:serine/threonine-protein phosphatase 6 regulatory ankyrin repeat subunit B-like [Pyrus ussuriensis x Pyrus communis]
MMSSQHHLNPGARDPCGYAKASDGADFGPVNSAGQTASVIAESARWALGFRQAVVDEIQSGEIVQSSHTSIFSPLVLVTQANDVEASKKLIEGADVDLNEQDEKGCSAAMIAAEGGYLETFKLLIDAGADINLQNKRGQTVMELFDTNHNSEEFEKLLFKNASPQKVLDSPVEFYRTQHQAVQHNAADFVHTLIGRDSDVSSKRKRRPPYAVRAFDFFRGKMRHFKCRTRDNTLACKEKWD